MISWFQFILIGQIYRQTLTVFLGRALDPDLRRGNFVIVLEYLQRISEKNELALHETCAMALRRIAECVAISESLADNADSDSGFRAMRR
jgi:hypothetical protein